MRGNQKLSVMTVCGHPEQPRKRGVRTALALKYLHAYLEVNIWQKCLLDFDIHPQIIIFADRSVNILNKIRLIGGAAY